MTLLPVLLAAAAVLLAVPRPARRWSRADPVDAAGASPARRRPASALLLGGTGVLVLLGLGLALDGARGLVLAATAVLVSVTTARLVVLRSRRLTAERAARAVVEACSVLAANLRVGQVPSRALATAAAACPVLRPGHETLLLGGDVATTWLRQSVEPGAGGLRELARAWRVASRSGASLGATLEQVAAGQSAEQALRGVVGGELAAPRATGKLMAVLPLLGLGMGYLLGGDPVDWLLSSPAGWTCTLVGAALACGGVLWIEALARAAAEQC